MVLLLIGIVLGGLVVFALTRQHKAEALLYRRLYDEATKSGPQQLHDPLRARMAQRALDAEGSEVPDAEPPRPARADAEKKTKRAKPDAE